MKEITVTIAKDGSSVKTEVAGVKGPSCEDLTKAMVNALGHVEESGKTPEYYLQDVTVIHNNE
jgi:hypothetical protein